MYIVSPPSLEEALGRITASAAGLRYRLVSLSDVARRLGIEDAGDLAWCDLLFVSLLARRAPRHQYAPAREVRDYTLYRVRSGLRAASLLAVAAGLLGGGSDLAGGYRAGRLAESLELRAGLYGQRYDEARERLPPAPAELPVLHFAVETAESLHAARTSPEALLFALNRVLDSYPGVHLESIDWSAGADSSLPLQSGNSPQVGSEPGAGGGVPGSGAASLQWSDLHGRIEPFDGDFRRALAQVAVLADALRALPGTVAVEVLSLPLDIASGASLRGDAGAGAGAAEAHFALRLRWSPGGKVEGEGMGVMPPPSRGSATLAARRMERFERGGKALARALLPFALALGAGAAMIGGASHYRDLEENRLEESGRELRQLRARYRSMDDEERRIEALLPRFRALEAQGVIGPETRLEWVETLRAASRCLALPELRYTLGTQERLQAALPGERAGFGVYRSLMELHLGLLHEEDLFRLFALMERESQGLFQVTSCRIRWAGAHFVHLPAAVNLRVVCVLEWLSLREPGAGP